MFVLSIEDRSETDGPDETDEGLLGVDAKGLDERDGGGGGMRRNADGSNFCPYMEEAGSTLAEPEGNDDNFGGGTLRK